MNLNKYSNYSVVPVTRISNTIRLIRVYEIADPTAKRIARLVWFRRD
ncbi:MAG: hypothetical protein LBT09_09455 [Planctomycetaceae bacterium]|nr:hypothetical protein [Planctomycetaceae bacterium]